MISKPKFQRLSKPLLRASACFPKLVMTCAVTAAILSGACAQTTESLEIDEIAPGAPAWMASLATADDFRDPTSSTQLETKNFSEYSRTPSRGPVYHQAAGALSGKVLFAMAGHGWTYDAEKMYYYTQRGLSHGLVEDMGNADQMHIFSRLAFNAGATIIPLRPIDHQLNERILDNSMPQVQFFGQWRAGSSDRYYGSEGDSVPYAVTSASLTETAVARYQPYIPEAGYYPVYVWARDGVDRSNQLYRVQHSGGTAEIRVNWRQVGKAWAWLGTYYFEKGYDGFVEISNQVIDPYEAYSGAVVVADAVRFGNGRGDVPRPGGISGFGREDEGDCYWIQRSLGVGADRLLYDIGSDGNSTVSSPPKAAAHINREKTGSYLDRILISFHSNASSGKARGAVALFNASAKQRPTYQESLAEIIGQEVNLQMRTQPAPVKESWSDRERHTYSGINFGELRRDYLQNEMAATIVEVAFHDNAEDVAFLMSPVARLRMAEATLRGVFRWYSDISANSSYVMPPPSPVAIAATIENGKIKVQWKTGPEGKFEGGPTAAVRVYRSPNGYGFDGGIATAHSDDALTLDPLTTSGVTFLRVTASNGAGESLPSQTIAVCPQPTTGSKSAASPRTLLLAVNTVLDSTTNIPYPLGTQPGGGPYRTTAETQRVRAVYAQLEPSGLGEALALAAAGVGFDGADTKAYEMGLIKPEAPYKRIVVTADQQDPSTPLLSSKLLERLRDYVSKNGKLLITGSGFARNLSDSGGMSSSFLSEVCGITGVTQVRPEAQVASLDDRFLSTTATLSLSIQSRFWATEAPVSPAQFTLKKGRSLGLLQYLNPASDGYSAALTRPFATEGEVVILGFPMNLVKDPAQRKVLMQAILKQL